MSDEKLDALGLLSKLRQKGETSGANRGLQVIAANTAIKVIREQEQRITELEANVSDLEQELKQSMIPSDSVMYDRKAKEAQDG